MDLREQLILETLEAAMQRVSKADFELHCKLQQNGAGVSFNDRTQVLDHLLQEEHVVVDHGYLALNYSRLPDLLRPYILDGVELAWKICDSIDTDAIGRSKFDNEILELIGLDGELAVINQLSKELPSKVHSKVIHVSLFSDSAGYDISTPSVDDHDRILKLEVKTTTRASRPFRFFISRNEVEVATKNSDWYLVFVRKSYSNFEVVGHTTIMSLYDRLPVNRCETIRWESLCIDIKIEELRKGLP
jgi:hypothetical protein